MQQQGILAIWNDVREGHEAEFNHWFQSEHLLERLAVPGFLFGRRHRADFGVGEPVQFLSGGVAGCFDVEVVS